MKILWDLVLIISLVIFHSTSAITTTPKDWIEASIDKHNSYRAKHGVPPLKHNQSITETSENYAYTLVSTGALLPNPHLAALRLGENLWTTGGRKGVPTADQVVTDWYNEIKDYDFKTGQAKSGKTFYDIAHFTQLVWKETTDVGIAYAEASDGTIFVVANYFPPGNVDGDFVANVPPSSTASNGAIPAGGVNDTSVAKKYKVAIPWEHTKITSSRTWLAEVVESHNYYRALHLTPPLIYSENITRYSQYYANKMLELALMAHGLDSNNSLRPSLGENLFSGSTYYTGYEVTTALYSEIVAFNFKRYNNVPDKYWFYDIGHFTQLIWGKSRYIGAAYAMIPKKNFFVAFHYSPAGNHIYRKALEPNVLPGPGVRAGLYKNIKSSAHGFGCKQLLLDQASNLVIYAILRRSYR